MGYAQWIRVTLKCASGIQGPLQVRTASLQYGKWYNAQTGNMDDEVASPGGESFKPGQPLVFASCGRENSPTGTEGSFEIWDTSSDLQVGGISWDCPYIGGNKIDVREAHSETYIISQRHPTPSSGAIGDVEFDVMPPL